MDDVLDVVQEALAEGEAAAEAAILGTQEGGVAGEGGEEAPPAGSEGESQDDGEAVGDSAGADEAQEIVDRETPKAGGPSWRSDLDIPADASITFEKNGEEVTVSLDKLVKHSRQLSEVQRIEQKIRTERNEAAAALKELEGIKEKAEASDRILEEILSGNDQLLQRMRTKFKEVAGAGGVGPGAGAGAGAGAGKTPPVDDAEVMAAGERVVQEVITPWAADLAQAYGADANDLAEEIINMIGQEPNIDVDGVLDIMERRILVALEEAGYTLEGEMPTLDKGFLQASQPAPTKTKGLRPKGAAAGGTGGGRKTPREIALEKQLAAAKARLQEEATNGAPSGTGQKAAGVNGRKAKGKGRDVEAKSDLLDLTEDDNVEDILKKVRDL